MKQITSRIDRILRSEIREIAAPISKEGVEATEICSDGWGGSVSAKEFESTNRPEIFTPSTVILNNGYGVWELEIPAHVRRRLVDMTLKIETIRTHGMLHSPEERKKAARIIVNDQLVDRISLVKPHPHGEDYGVDSRRPFPIFRFIDKDIRIQKIRIEVDEKVLWDIDRVTLEPIVLRKEIKPEAAMIIGAIISALIGGMVSFLVT